MWARSSCLLGDGVEDQVREAVGSVLHELVGPLCFCFIFVGSCQRWRAVGLQWVIGEPAAAIAFDDFGQGGLMVTVDVGYENRVLNLVESYPDRVR